MHVNVNHRNLLLFVTAGLALMFSSCASLTGFQDGRTIGENRGEVMVSLNSSGSPEFTDLINDQDTNNVNIGLPITFANFELGGRYGITEKLDVSMKINTTFSAALGAKYQLVGNQTSKFALAAGLDVGTVLLAVYNVQVPLYLSVHPTEMITIYATPRYIYQFPFVGLVDWSYAGGNFGLLFGRKHKFGIDAGIYQVGRRDVGNIRLTTIGIGGKFVFGNSKSDDDRRMRD
jgi:hypothetical protein